MLLAHSWADLHGILLVYNKTYENLNNDDQTSAKLEYVAQDITFLHSYMKSKTCDDIWTLAQQNDTAADFVSKNIFFGFLGSSTGD